MKKLCAFAFSLAACSCGLHAQTTAATLPPPAPAGLVYRYWPEQFVQWLPADAPWSMVELDVDARGAKPLLHVVLSTRADGKRVQYTNQPEELAWDQASGGEAHLVAMALDGPAEPANGATYQLRFATETNTPVAWQFVVGSDVSEQGSGLTVVNTPSPVLLYREQGGVAGQGTALKVGASTYAADVWNEISQPPYFVAYHGALSLGVHVLACVPITAEWTASGAPAELVAGASWTWTAAKSGAVLHAKVDSMSQGSATVHETSSRGGLDMLLDVHKGTGDWTLDRVRYLPTEAGSGDHSFSVSLRDGRFELIAGKKTKLAAGTVVTTTEGGSMHQTWAFTEPKEASKQAVQATVTVH